MGNKGSHSAPHDAGVAAAAQLQSLDVETRAALQQWWHGTAAPRRMAGLPAALQEPLCGRADLTLAAFEARVGALLEDKRGAALECVLGLLGVGADLTGATLRQVLRVCAECYWAVPNQWGAVCATPSADEAEQLELMAVRLLGDGGAGCSVEALMRALAKTWPRLGCEVGRVVLRACGAAKEADVSSAGGVAPSDKVVPSRVAAWQMSLLPMRGSEGSWTQLYSNAAHGEGASSLFRAVGLYAAPTVVLVRCTSGDIVGFYCDAEWQNSASAWFGSSNCFLFTVAPVSTLLETTGISRNWAYFHIPTGKGLVPDGLGIGGQMGAFRFSLDADLLKGTACRYGTTYAEGQLCPRAALTDATPDALEFAVDALEVWGLGGPRALAAQEASRQRAIKEAMKRRQVNRRIVLGGGSDDDNADMWLLEMGGVHESHAKEANHV